MPVAHRNTVFDTGALISGGEELVVRSEYGADVDDFAPAAFPPPYEVGFSNYCWPHPPHFDLVSYVELRRLLICQRVARQTVCPTASESS